MNWLFTNKNNDQVQHKTKYNNYTSTTTTPTPTPIIYDEDKDREDTYAKAYRLDEEKRKRLHEKNNYSN